MVLTFLQLAEKILGEEARALPCNQIWSFAVAKGDDKQLSTRGKTPWATLAAQLYVDVRDNPHSIFETRGGRPKLFALKSSPILTPAQIVATAPLNIKKPINIKKPTAVLEKDLHPLLAYCCYNLLGGIRTKTINHSCSKKVAYGEWIHPDMIGCTYSFQEREALTASIARLTAQAVIRLFSFELKRKLDDSNLRESFFQAVSNSSWANEGYLAAANIAKDSDFRKELERLSSSFGIGVIELDMIEPDNSMILFSAKAKESLSLDGLDKLIAMKNTDVLTLLESINRSASSKHTHKDDYDPVLEREVLLKHYQDKAQVP